METGTLPLHFAPLRRSSPLVPKGVPRLLHFDANVLSLYAFGASVSEVWADLEEL